MRLTLFRVLIVVAILVSGVSAASAVPSGKMIGVNVALNTDITEAILADLASHGTVRDLIFEIDALAMQTKESELPAIQAKSYVAAANPDARRNDVPVTTVPVADFQDGLSTWDLDAINVTDFGVGRTTGFDGEGVYVAVLDTGLVNSWRAYFPEERIATQFAKAFGGGGGDNGWVSSQPNKWERDVNSHGTHVTSTIIGYSLLGAPINGVASKATIIPVKVLNQNGSGWSSVIACGIVYIADLKANGKLGAAPVVINMSLGGSVLDAVEKAAIDYAISQGVIIVASAGNRGAAGMGYPGAYEPVISVAASGWIGEWTASTWWRTLDVPDPTNPADYYIADFSSRAKAGQDLDVAAPGTWVVGPYETNNGQLSYYYLGGTSMASPHVAGIVALMAQKLPGLNASQAEGFLEASAVYLAPGCRTVIDPNTGSTQFCWDADATGAGLATADAALAAIP